MAEVKRVKPPKNVVRNKSRFETTTYVLTKKWDKPTLEGKHFPATYSLPTEDEIFCEWIDEKTKETVSGNRIIRFVPGETSIFADEQSEGAEQRRKRGVIVFIDGILHVKGNEVLKKQFLDMCNWNSKNAEVAMEGKTSIFYQLDLESKAEEQLDLKRKIHRLESAIFDMDEQELRGLAMTFGVRNYNKLGLKELTNYMLDMMKYDPDAFEEEYKSDDRKKKFWIMTAFDEEYLSLDKHTNEVWYNLGEPTSLVKVPLNQDVYDFVTDLSGKSKTVGEAVDTLINVLKKEAVKGKGSVKLESKGLDVKQRMINLAFEYEILKQKGSWVNMINEGNICQGKSNLPITFEEDPSLFKKLEKAVEDFERDLAKAKS